MTSTVIIAVVIAVMIACIRSPYVNLQLTNPRKPKRKLLTEAEVAALERELEVGPYNPALASRQQGLIERWSSKTPNIDQVRHLDGSTFFIYTCPQCREWTGDTEYLSIGASLRHLCEHKPDRAGPRHPVYSAKRLEYVPDPEQITPIVLSSGKRRFLWTCPSCLRHFAGNTPAHAYSNGNPHNCFGVYR